VKTAKLSLMREVYIDLRVQVPVDWDEDTVADQMHEGAMQDWIKEEIHRVFLSIADKNFDWQDFPHDWEIEDGPNATDVFLLKNPWAEGAVPPPEVLLQYALCNEGVT